MSATEYTLGILLVFFMPVSCSSRKEKLQGPAMSVATDYVNTVYNESLSLSLTYATDDNPSMNMVLSNDYTPRLVAEWYYRKRDPQRLTIVLIPSASLLSDLTYMFQQWNTLFITVTSMNPAIKDRVSNPTWISTARVNYPAMTLFFCEVLLKYGWTTFMTILDVESGAIYRGYATRTVEDFIDLTGRTPLQRQINATSFYDYQSLLQDIRSLTRIVIIFGTGRVVRDFLIAANKANMTNGDYVYMAFEVSDNLKVYGRMHWKVQDENDMVAQQAFRSLLIMRPQDIYDIPNTNLEQQFMARTQRDFNYTYNIKNQPYLNMLASHTAVTAVAQVLHELWIEGTDMHILQNGTYLATQFLNRTFDNNISQIYIDDKGGRQMDTYMWRFDENGSQSKFLYKRAAGNAPVVELHNITQWANGTWPPVNEPVCGYTNERQSCRTEVRSGVIGPVLGAVLICILAVFAGIRYGRMISGKAQDIWWEIAQSDLQYTSMPQHAAAARLFHSVGDHKTGSQIRAPYFALHLAEKFSSGKLKGLDVLIETVVTLSEHSGLSHITPDRSILLDLNKMRNLVHINISRFYGIIMPTSGTHSVIRVVMEWAGRGCIYDVFDGMANMDSTLSNSLANDFLEGVQYVHSSSFGYHGCLCGLHCHVDKHFTLKISGLINWRLQKSVHDSYTTDNVIFSRYGFCGKTEISDVDQKQKADIYAVGVVLRELFTKGALHFSTEDLEDAPAMDHDGLQDFEHILELCCSSDISNRPSAKQVREKLSEKSFDFSARQSGIKLIDKIQKRLIDYTKDLENEVSLRTRNLLDEIARCDEIIGLFLPRWAAAQIRMGNHVEGELFDSASILFTQICGFEDFLARNDPKTFIDIIHKSEAMVDQMIEPFSGDVYKVEAVQDCYMIASGLPVRNGDRHSRVTAEMALKLQHSASPFFAQFDLQLKSGIHSGPCAAGVVGARRLRYCLFGDTVNTAARMCSSGTPRRIQITQSTASMLEWTRLFDMQYRGAISVKGKSDMTTYWLNGYLKECT